MTKSEVILEMNLKESQKLNLPFDPKKEDFDKFAEIFEKRRNQPKTKNIEKQENTEKKSEQKQEKKTEKKQEKKQGKKQEKKREKKSKNIKEFPEIPIIKHESDKPKTVFEETNNGKLKATIYDYSSSATEIKEEKEADEKSQNKNCVNKSNDKKEQLRNKPTNKEKQDKNKNNKNEDYDSSTASTTVTNTDNNENKDKNEKKLRNKGKKKNESDNHNKNSEKRNDKLYENIPIIEHNSEKPSKTFEENYSGKLRASHHDLGNNNNKDNEQNLKNGPKKYENKNKICNKKFQDIPVVQHNSQKPSIVYEEINNGKI